jgi:NAD(P)-dependent dehydrogenase (short-subunit alcohol dehydrogenase family)
MVDFKEKYALVTGATNGIGFVTALELARLGITVMIVGRNEARCLEAVKRIADETGNPTIHYMVADLSDMRAVRLLAQAYRAQFNQLDILVNNVGAIFMKRLESVDGLEMTFALNHMSYFVLTQDLLPLIQHSAERDAEFGARIVNVSSGAHVLPVNWKDLQFQRSYSGFRAYSQSKHMNVLFTYELAKRLAGTGITVNALHPGAVATNFMRDNGWFSKALSSVAKVFQKSPQEGAQTSIYLSTSPNVHNVSGKYFDNCAERKSFPATYDPKAWARLWEISQQIADRI